MSRLTAKLAGIHQNDDLLNPRQKPPFGLDQKGVGLHQAVAPDGGSAHEEFGGVETAHAVILEGRQDDVLFAKQRARRD